jgi:hypothetical protein
MPQNPLLIRSVAVLVGIAALLFIYIEILGAYRGTQEAIINRNKIEQSEADAAIAKANATAATAKALGTTGGSAITEQQARARLDDIDKGLLERNTEILRLKLEQARKGGRVVIEDTAETFAAAPSANAFPGSGAPIAKKKCRIPWEPQDEGKPGFCKR